MSDLKISGPIAKTEDCGDHVEVTLVDGEIIHLLPGDTFDITQTITVKENNDE